MQVKVQHQLLLLSVTCLTVTIWMACNNYILIFNSRKPLFNEDNQTTETITSVNTVQFWHTQNQTIITTQKVGGPGTTPISRPLPVYSNSSFVLEFKFTIDKPHICQNDTLLIVVVNSASRNSMTRSLIRQTWGSVIKHDNQSAILFLLGTSGSLKVNTAVALEDKEHGDIVQANYVDTYRNLSIKSLLMLKLATMNCHGARYLLKIDDDMILNIRNLKQLLETLSARNNTNFEVGRLAVGWRPQRGKTDRWYTTKEEYSKDVYPNFLSGPAYMIGNEAIRILLAACLRLPLFWLEDIFVTGMCAENTTVERIYNSSFFNRIITSDNKCLFSEVITAEVQLDSLLKIWNETSSVNNYKFLSSNHSQCQNLSVIM